MRRGGNAEAMRRRKRNVGGVMRGWFYCVQSANARMTANRVDPTRLAPRAEAPLELSDPVEGEGEAPLPLLLVDEPPEEEVLEAEVEEGLLLAVLEVEVAASTTDPPAAMGVDTIRS